MTLHPQMQADIKQASRRTNIPIVTHSLSQSAWALQGWSRDDLTHLQDKVRGMILQELVQEHLNILHQADKAEGRQKRMVRILHVENHGELHLQILSNKNHKDHNKPDYTMHIQLEQS